LEDDVDVGANTTIDRGFSLLFPSEMTYKPPIPKGQVELDRAAALPSEEPGGWADVNTNGIVQP